MIKIAVNPEAVARNRHRAIFGGSHTCEPAIAIKDVEAGREVWVDEVYLYDEAGKLVAVLKTNYIEPEKIGGRATSVWLQTELTAEYRER